MRVRKHEPCEGLTYFSSFNLWYNVLKMKKKLDNTCEMAAYILFSSFSGDRYSNLGRLKLDYRGQEI